MLAIYTSAIHAHHRLALRALSSNASLFLRIKRYNARMAIVRTLKAAGGVV
jgi:hypothetical protein